MKTLNKPLISIIMNCYNGEKYLYQSLKSLILQEYTNWELIFWDNKSTDDSKKIVLNFKDKRIKYFRSQNYYNLYKSRNLAIKKAKGKYICFLDVDDWWKKNKLVEQVNLIKKKKINFIFSNYYIFREATKTKKTCFTSKVPDGRITKFLLKNYVIGILTVMINKKIFLKKKFNANYNIIGDFDFFLNLSLNEKFYSINKPLAYYRYHETNFSHKYDTYIKELKFWINKNEKKFKKLNYSLFFIKILIFKLNIKYFFEKLGRIVQW